MHLNNRQVKSRVYYPGFGLWFNNVFAPSYLDGGRDIITIRDKRYGTLLGFALFINASRVGFTAAQGPQVELVNLSTSIILSPAFALLMFIVTNINKTNKDEIIFFIFMVF